MALSISSFKTNIHSLIQTYIVTFFPHFLSLAIGYCAAVSRIFSRRLREILRFRAGLASATGLRRCWPLICPLSTCPLEKWTVVADDDWTRPSEMKKRWTPPACRRTRPGSRGSTCVSAQRTAEYRPHSMTPAPTCSRGSSPDTPTFLQGCRPRRVGRVGQDLREDVGVSVVECGLICCVSVSIPGPVRPSPLLGPSPQGNRLGLPEKFCQLD